MKIHIKWGALVLLAALGGCGGGSGTSLPTSSGAGGTIVYISTATRNADGTGTNGDIYSADSNGQNVRRVTTTPEIESFPDVTLDGRTIVYLQHPNQTSAAELRLINIDGTNSRRVLGPGSYSTPKISPDGSTILYLDSSTILNSVKADGSQNKRLTENLVIDLACFAFNSDGTRIAFVGRGRNFGAPVTRPRGIYTMATDGSDIRPVTLDTATRGFGGGLDYGANGDIVTGTGDRTSGNSKNGIFVVRDDGTNERIIPTPGEQAFYPTLSPDGTEVAYDSFVNDRPVGKIYVQKVDGSGRRLFNDFGVFPSWGAKVR